MSLKDLKESLKSCSTRTLTCSSSGGSSSAAPTVPIEPGFRSVLAGSVLAVGSREASVSQEVDNRRLPPKTNLRDQLAFSFQSFEGENSGATKLLPLTRFVSCPPATFLSQQKFCGARVALEPRSFSTGNVPSPALDYCLEQQQPSRAKKTRGNGLGLGFDTEDVKRKRRKLPSGISEVLQRKNDAVEARQIGEQRHDRRRIQLGSDDEEEEDEEIGGGEEDVKRDSEAGFFIRAESKGLYEPLVLWPPPDRPVDGGDEVVQVPASINSRLLEHQREGVRFLYKLYRENRGGILGDDMYVVLTFFSVMVQLLRRKGSAVAIHVPVNFRAIHIPQCHN
jgi:hypothetical protein